jgi:general secretion pathway protein H
MGLRRAHRPAQAGFTLMEVVVVMVLFAMMALMAAPYVNSALGVEVKSEARKLAGTMRYLFDEASIQGANYRIVFNLDRHAYLVEKCPGPSSAILYRSFEERRRGEEAEAERIRQQEDYAKSSSAAVPLADTALSSCAQSTDPELIPVTLKDPITLLGVWTAQYPAVVRGNPGGPPEDPTQDTIAVVNFLKGGYAERAFIYLSDGGDDIYTLELEPLTGHVILHEGEYDVPREYWRPQ